MTQFYLYKVESNKVRGNKDPPTATKSHLQQFDFVCFFLSYKRDFETRVWHRHVFVGEGRSGFS